MQGVDGHVLGSLWHFIPRYHVLDARSTPAGFRNLAELRRRLRHVMLRRDKRLVRDQLPERIVQTVPVTMTPAQLDLHDGCLRRAGRFAAIRERRALTPREEKELLAALLGARLACNAAGLLDKVTVGSPKLDELARILEAVCVDGGENVVVFSQWETMTRMAEDVATGLGLSPVRLHSGLDTRQRRDAVDRFCQDPDAQVFISTDAGATGLNLQVASVFVNLDLPWNPALLEQPIGRVYRLGRSKPSTSTFSSLRAATKSADRISD